MTENENVVKLPDPLERRALRIEAAIARRDKGRVEWIEGTIILAEELYGAYLDHSSTQAFGKWFGGRFNSAIKSTFSGPDRAILIRWGAATTDELRAVLEKDESTSIQGIAKRHPELGKPKRTYTKRATPAAPLLDAVTPMSKPAPPPPPKPNKIEAVAQIIKEETGQWPSSIKLAQVAGVNPRNADNALRTVKAVEAAVQQLPLPTYTKAQDRQVEARIKVLEAEFDERVRLTMLEHNKDYRAKLATMIKEASEEHVYYRKLINSHRPIFNDTEYMNIVRACHPDNSAGKETRESAFRAGRS